MGTVGSFASSPFWGALEAVLPVAEGLQSGLVSMEIKRLEDSVRAGENGYLTAILQFSQGIKAVEFADRAIGAAGLSPLPWWGRWVTYLTPVVFALAKKVAPDQVRPFVLALRNHLGTLYQIAAVASSVALLFLGQLGFAIASLTLLTIGFLDRKGWLPLTMRQFLHRYTQPFLIVTGLFCGGPLDRIFALLGALAWCAELSLAQNKIARDDLAQGSRLTYAKVSHGFLPAIDRTFVHYNPFPPVPQINILSLLDKFDEIDWERHLATLRKKLENDERFAAQQGDPAEKTDEEIIVFARKELESFLRGVEERRILDGEPHDYEKLSDYLKLIARSVQQPGDEMAQVDIVLRLAVEGGEYCGPGKFQVVEDIFGGLVGENPEIPFRDKIFYCLQVERGRWMEKFYYGVFGQGGGGSAVGRMIDWQDKHNFHAILNVYGEEFGLRKVAADNDDTAIIDPLTKWIVNHMFQEKIRDNFWQDYHLDHLTDTLVEAIGTSRMPKQEFYAFWRDWIKRQEEAEQGALRDELEEGHLFGLPIEVDGKVDRRFVTWMLFDLGVVVESQEQVVLQAAAV